MKLWSVTPTEVSPLADPYVGHGGSVTHVQFGFMAEDPSIPAVFSGSGSDNTVRVWRAIADGRVGLPLQGHFLAVSSVAVVVDGLTQGRITIASGSEDRSVQVCKKEAFPPCSLFVNCEL